MSDEGEGKKPEAADAAFEDAFRPTRLMVRDVDDLAVVSALMQDAVILIKDAAWIAAERRFAFVASRYRWEEPDARERIQTGVHFEGVLGVRAKGVDPSEGDAPLAILAISFEPDAEPPGGRVRIACAGEAEYELTVEALEAAFADISKPWKASQTPRHDVEGDSDGETTP